MNKSSEDPFADYSEANGRLIDKKTGISPVTRILRLVSRITLGLAFLSAVITVIAHFVNWFYPALFAWRLKSAVPLILIGVSYSSLQIALPRTLGQHLLSLIVGLAFMLWGAEQFLSNQAIVALIDDIVVCLFVLDLSVVIYRRLARDAVEGP